MNNYEDMFNGFMHRFQNFPLDGEIHSQNFENLKTI